MPVSRTKRAQIAERRRRCVELRTEGKQFTEIADILGYGSRGAACQDFGRALKERLAEQAEAVDHYRELELERLDALYRKAWAVLNKPHLLVQGGRPVVITGDDDTEIRLHDDGPTLQAIDRLLKIAERRARLLGLDSPVKIDQGGQVTYVIEGVSMDALR